MRCRTCAGHNGVAGKLRSVGEDYFVFEDLLNKRGEERRREAVFSTCERMVCRAEQEWAETETPFVCTNVGYAEGEIDAMHGHALRPLSSTHSFDSVLPQSCPCAARCL